MGGIIMDYEKKYKEALEKARQLCAYPTTKPFISDLQDLFPELKKSEGDSIRKELIGFLRNNPNGNYTCEEMAAWLEKQGYTKKDVDDAYLKGICNTKHELEKQGEQESADKHEPKFNVGDWITNGDYTWKVIEVEQFDYILQSQDGNIVDDTISYVDKKFHSFTVKDAKDGDVLCTYECGTPKIVFILKGTPKKHYALGYHCYYNIMYPHFGPDSEKGCLAPNDEDVKPATKEQRDTLERAITNAGYTFNFEKKELKKIKQKPQRMVSAEAKEALYDKPTDEEMKELLRTEYEKGRADTIAEMEKDWSEEDDVMLQACLDTLQAKSLMGKVDTTITMWLKSLKVRIGG